MPGRALSDEAPSFSMQSVNRSDFAISAAAPDGKIIFVTTEMEAIVIFDPANGNFETIDTSGQVGQLQLRTHYDEMFRSSATSADGKIILVPAEADEVGIFDPAGKELELVDISGQVNAEPGTWKFEGGALAPNGDIIFAPAGSSEVGIFDPASKTLELVDISEQVSEVGYYYFYYMFSDAVATPDGKVVFVPGLLNAVGLFDTAEGNFEAIDINPQVEDYMSWYKKFGKGALAPNGKVIFAPCWADGVGIFDPASKTLEVVNIIGQFETSGDGGNMFWGAALAHGGKVVFAPTGSRSVGLFDTSTSTFEAMNISEQVSSFSNGYYMYYMFTDAVATPDGSKVIFAPRYSPQVGIVTLTTMTTTTSMLIKLKLKVKKGVKALLKVKIVNGQVNATAKVKAGRRRG